MVLARVSISIALMTLVACSANDGDAEPDLAPSMMSPYANDLASEVRGLSAQEVDDLRNGRGMGLARAAELNGYPGPRHVLDLASMLELSDDQRPQIEELFQNMDAQARQLGEEILLREQNLSAAFADRTIDENSLPRVVGELATFYGQLRATHLGAHLAVEQVLTPQQRTRYDELRGYSDPGAHHAHAK